MEGVLEEPLPPDDLRCKRTDGRDWRCKRPVVDGKSFCLSHIYRGQKQRNPSSTPNPNPKPKPEPKPKPRIRIRLPVKPEPIDDVVFSPPPLNQAPPPEFDPVPPPPVVGPVPVTVPDHLRCHRNDGRSWRCKKQVLEGQTLCEIHFNKAKAQNQRRPIMRRKKKEEGRKDGPGPMPEVRENGLGVGPVPEVNVRCGKKQGNSKGKGNAGGVVVAMAVPESLRCARNDGRDWRCKSKVVEGQDFCEAHFSKIKLKDLVEEEKSKKGNKRKKKAKGGDDLEQGAVPVANKEVVIKVEREDDLGVGMEVEKGNVVSEKVVVEKENSKRVVEEEELRCKRTDGRGWRCKRRVLEGKTLCEIHYEQGRLRQMRITVPEELKLQRGDGGEKIEKKLKRKRELETLENNSDKGMKRMKAELIRVFLRREILESKKKSEKRPEESGEVTRDLPYGLMAIPPAPNTQLLDNAGSLGIKIGAHCSNSLVNRRFRSKNIEPPPISSLKVVPYPGNVEKVRNNGRKKCHWCRKFDNLCLIKCSSCKKRFFCSNCIKERSADTEEVKSRCPVCRGSCDCKACSSSKSKDTGGKVVMKVKCKRSKFQHLQYLINFLLPILVQINEEQSAEVEMEAKVKGMNPSDVEIRQADVGCRDQCCCNNCKSPILDIHRSCPNCSYNLCFSCCREYSQGGSLKGTYPNRAETLSPCLKKCSDNVADLAASGPILDSTSSVHISCPPMELGGCDNSLLDLRCIFPLNWTKELEISAKETASEHDSLHTNGVVHCSSCVSISQGGDKSKELAASSRKESDDNLLYCPSMSDDHDCLLSHFQKRWRKGHPIKIRNVLQCVWGLSWDPLAMFCGYLENGLSNCKNLKGRSEATNCSDSYDVEIGTRESFTGSVEEGYMHKHRETLAVKAKISSDFSRKLLEGYYSEIIRALPLQEYTNPGMGLLNIAGKLPEDFPDSKLGPHVCISCGSREEVARGELLTKLCCNSYDLVNILVHVGDAPCSSEQFNKIKKLIKRNSNTKDKGSQASDKDLDNETRVMHSEISVEAGELHRVAGASCCSAATNGASAVKHLPNNKSSPAKLVNSSDTDSDASMICSRTSQSPEKAVDQIPQLDSLGDLNLTDKSPPPGPSGAQWDVFRRQDIPKLLEYITKHVDELRFSYGVSDNVVHPIFDGSFYLDADHKMQLKEEFEIEPWSFNQRLGEAVFIPVGCPYQIKNVKSCVNIAMGFLSPENASECIKLINEIRVLPNNHKAKQGNLEVEKMTICSIDEAIKEIYRLRSEEGSR
ncbi:uncharacterized protein LOC110687212 isoform X2 [Chenopodium quinoa]|uniref:uncharacterized protein LOC110687212 isoform X2 n=1 Tax=Chenopodium quinoa TaxID=63459 RepID=UPI000B798C6C|nr:uncharacterized protein LOC110687212 isoform X2 [Chenopodium quinoa]